ncbi:sensor histidine kinase [Phreatobacter stygius]|uniref:sensor histidine kinase n=1 Tax=Phreatobacter stygius TaxID=1940610 RepID=UPI001476ECDE|nr:ATP-binding protein [Phreatobacter stygius]
MTETANRDMAVEPTQGGRSAWRWLAGWAVASLIAAGLATYAHVQALDGQMQAVGQTLHRVISQRADQHDALLTSIGAVVRVPGPLRSDLVAVLAESVQRFYPRVRTIAVVEIGAEPKVLFSTHPDDAINPPAGAVAARLATEPPGRSVVLPGAAGSGFYHVVKRAGSEPLALLLTVDAARLIEAEPGMVTAAVGLTAEDGTAIVAPIPAGGAVAGWRGPVLDFQKVLGSQSQPLTLSLTRNLGLAETVPFSTIAAIAAALGLVAWLGHRVVTERRKAEAARRHASLSADEARFAQATRVNAMGELASGIAHELAQPIAAILSQSQAGARLVRSEPLDRQAVIQALEANARLAKRAGAILDRLRDYVRPGAPERQPTNAGELVGHVVALIRGDVAGRGVHLSVGPLAADASVLVEPIAVEQALHNLVRNAAEAVEALAPERRRIDISTGFDGGMVEIVVEDRGPGLAPELLARLFEPFRSTKPNGMGLGLALSQRLVEANGGRIAGGNRPDGGARFTIALPLHRAEPQRREAAE